MQHGKSTPHPDAATGDLTQWGGITVWATVLSINADAIARAAHAVTPLMDTGTNKARESHERPTDPALRCIAWARERIRAPIAGHRSLFVSLLQKVLSNAERCTN